MGLGGRVPHGVGPAYLHKWASREGRTPLALGDFRCLRPVGSLDPERGGDETVFVPPTRRVEVHPFGVRFGVRFQEPVFSPDLRSNILCFGLSRRTIDNWFQRECRPGRYGESR